MADGGLGIERHRSLWSGRIGSRRQQWCRFWCISHCAGKIANGIRVGALAVVKLLNPWLDWRRRRVLGTSSASVISIISLKKLQADCDFEFVTFSKVLVGVENLNSMFTVSP